MSRETGLNQAARKDRQRFGAVVFSVDFELHWGVRDVVPDGGAYHQHLVAERDAVPAMLRLFEKEGFAATWATVGFLFAGTREELERYSPKLKPAYQDPTLSPYHESIGDSESADPLHFARQLVDQIKATPRQEIGTHTYSHYYCLEPGQSRESFRADIQAARAIAADNGVELKSIVFPRNQVNLAYADILLEEGITSYRGNENSWIYKCHEKPGKYHPVQARLGRLADTYLNLTGDNTIAWSQVLQPEGICNIPSSRFIRPFTEKLESLEGLRLTRIRKVLRHAAETGTIAHLWTHAHNLGINMEKNMQFLAAILEEVRLLNSSHGFQSLTMNEVAEAVL